MGGRALVIASAAILIVSLLASGSAAGQVDGMGAAKSFKKFPVYWAGEEVAGFPLEDISSSSNGFTFFYGSCELAGTDHPSCAPPIEIQLFSTCDRWANSYTVEKLFPFRGAMAYMYRPKPGEGIEIELSPFEIFTGRETVVVWVEPGGLKHPSEMRKVALAVGRALRTVHQSQPPAKLPPPAKGTLGGTLPCQKPPAP